MGLLWVYLRPLLWRLALPALQLVVRCVTRKGSYARRLRQPTVKSALPRHLSDKEP